MAEPAKPFACTIVDCGMSFTNEDHLHVHTKKHDMCLQLGLEQKAAFAADQTPTPTRFIRNCEEVGLFQDLQNVAANPFDEGFKRAMETKTGILSLETITPSSDDVLHTPQMVFPLLDSGDPTLFNSQRNITISRSSSDESGAIKEFETRSVSKLTSEITTISRIVNVDDVTVKHAAAQKDAVTQSYKNNIVRIENNIVGNIVGKDVEPVTVMVYADSVKTYTKTKENVVDNSKLVPEKLPIMSQKSIDYVVDSFTSEITNVAHNVEIQTQRHKNVGVRANNTKVSKIPITQLKKTTPPGVPPKKVVVINKLRKAPQKIMPKNVYIINEKVAKKKAKDYEVLIRLPDGTRVRMKPVDDDDEPDPKETIKNRITNKIAQPIINNSKTIINNNKTALKHNNTQKAATVPKPVPNVVNISSGTLIPVTLVNPEGTPLSDNDLNKVPITKISTMKDIANMKMPSLAQSKVNKDITDKNPIDKCEITRKIVPVDNAAMFVKISEPYQVNDDLTRINETVCLTEEDVSNRLQENKDREQKLEEDDDCVMIEDAEDETPGPESGKRQRIELERRCAASKRYRERLKLAMRKQSEENRQLREANQRLIAEKAILKLLITEHVKQCSNADDIANRFAMLTNSGNF